MWKISGPILIHAALVLVGFICLEGNPASVVFAALAGLAGISIFLLGIVWDDGKTLF